MKFLYKKAGGFTLCTRGITALLFLMLAGFGAAGQNGSYNFRNIIPPSATAASLGKYGEIPVSLYTGIPNISIPLYEIKDGPLSVPISLSYHAGGIRVEEVASSVGIGWALNAGGIVGRQVRGMQDEIGGWVTSNENRIETIIQSGNQGNINNMTVNLQIRSKDGEADIFYYNFNGKSGKFFFDQAGTIHNYPANGLKIVPIGGSFNSGTGWNITTEDGTVYEFDKAEHSESNACGIESLDTYTSWFVTKIKSADGSREISFTYEGFTTNLLMTAQETRYFPVSGSSSNFFTNTPPCSGYFTNYTQRLTRIDFSGGYVKFNYNTNRLDMPSQTDKELDQVEVYSSSNELLKKFDFGYSYFGANAQSFMEKRLKLTSITEKSLTGANPPYVFTYDESVQQLHRDSPSRDHWGYYNGKSNTTLIPTFTYSEGGNNYNIVGGADRGADPNFAQAFILKKILYPTGGETAFTYESNTTADARLQSPPTDTYFFLGVNNVPFSNLSSPYESNEFVIPPEGAPVSMTITGLNGPSRPGCDIFNAYLVKDNVVLGNLGDGNFVPVMRGGGTYKIRIEWDCYQGNLNYTCMVRAQIPNTSLALVKPAGGLRIKELEDRPGNGGQLVSKKYRYGNENNAAVSSGVMVNFPSYGYKATAEGIPFGGVCPGLNGSGGGPYLYETAIVAQGTTNYPLATTVGSYIGYAYVVEDMGANGEIRHRYKAYGSPQVGFPFVPFEVFDWQRGSELSTDYMAWKNGQLVKVKAIQNHYTAVDKATIKGYRISNNHRVTGTCPRPMPFSYPFVVYDAITQFYALSGVSETLYDQNDITKYTVSTTDYTYNTDHYQLAQVRQSSSSGSSSLVNEVITNRKYARDYTFTGTPQGIPAIGIKTLQDLNVINLPVEEYTYRQKRNTTDQQVSNQQVVTGTITTFKAYKPYADQIFRLEINSPLPLSTFGTGSTLSSNAFITNANSSVSAAYKPVISFSNYDGKGNLLQQQKTSGPPTTYIWGYNRQYPVAEVKNATYQELVNVLGQTVIDQLNNSLVSDTFVRTALSPLRAALPNASVTIFTYKPIVGITSSTDSKGMTTYFDYDAFQRLKSVRDKDQKIIRTTDYHYQGQ